MPNSLPGLFDSFDHLDQVKTEDIARWIKPQPPFEFVENYLAQKILYPQVLPITRLDMDIDLAILREAVRLSVPKDSKNALLGDNPFMNLTLRKILIPAKFLSFVENIAVLAWVFVDALLLERSNQDRFADLWTVVLTGEADEVVGSVILPEFSGGGGQLELKVMDKLYRIDAGTLTVIPCKRERCEIAFNVKSGKILGHENLAVEVSGGRLGLVVDSRRKQ